MTPIEQEVSQNRQIRGQVESARERHGYPAGQKNDLVMAYFDIIIEHHDAIDVLIEKQLVGSSFALLRPATESLFRALWVNGCATQAQLNQLLKDDDFEFPKDMMGKIDVAYSTQGFFQNLKRRIWKSMCSYAHSGLLPITRRLCSDGTGGPNFREAEILEVLRASTTVLLFAAILFFKSAGCLKEATEMESLAANYNKSQ